MSVKWCNGCKSMRPINDFHRSSQSKDGYRGTCKECRRDEEAAYREKIIGLNRDRNFPDDTEVLCPGCNKSKPVGDFARNRTMKSGLARLCKDCTEPYMQKYREQHRQYHAAYIVSWRKTSRGKHSRRSEQRGQRAKYPEKDYARRALRQAVRSGKVVKQPCAWCGEEKAEAHHADYSKPLDVVWVCHKHHMEHFHPDRIRAL